ncbi:hypothetical protein JCGZ_05200 [Jatropha curcas]|uniref:Uncharacterized protein n=1 Tax=Jatropha curcas TaxID=180498 RepID=A0A067L2K0_JATCU|nr:hypothetical protein JCGZ_05200 [Jatropha curcas]
MNLLSQKYLPGGFFIECLSSLTGACSEVSGAIPEVLLRSNLHCQIVSRAPRDVRDWQATETSGSSGRYCFPSPNGECRLRTRLEVEGIPLDPSDEGEDDDDDSSSHDALPLPPSSVRQAAAGPSQRRC